MGKEQEIEAGNDRGKRNIPCKMRLQKLKSKNNEDI